jgi:hypothetical protein
VSKVTTGLAIQHTELLDLDLLPMPVEYPLHRLVDLDDAGGRTPLRRTNQPLNLSYDDHNTHNLPWYHKTQRNVD